MMPKYHRHRAHLAALVCGQQRWSDMRRSLLCVTAFLSLSGAAAAADLPMVTKAPPASVFTWDGFYAGGHVGYLWGTTRVIDNGVLTEPHVPTNGVIGGVLAGYNRQSGPYVFGLEADFGWTHAHATGIPNFTVIELPNQYTVNWASYVRGRFGYLVTPTTLFYAAGGLALADFRFQEGGTIVVQNF